MTSIDQVMRRPALGESLAVGPLTIRNRVFLAPMSGVTDAAFRNLAWGFGAGLVFSEMVASEALVEGEAEMALKATAGDFRPHAVQLAGREERWMALAAAMACDNGAELIDINMGCPAKRVTTGQAGSALMREPDLAVRLVEAVVAAVDVPVTVKMRLGWDERSLNAPELARRAAEAGAAMITVHGRTRCQFYDGRADWSAVCAVRDAVKVPLVVNGDIGSPDDAQEALAASGADGVMVGRAAYGAPWLPGALAGEPRAAAMREPGRIMEVALDHFQAMLALHGEQSGLRQARKHVGWYLERAGFAQNSGLRRMLMTERDPSRVERVLRDLSKGSQAVAA